MRLKTVQNLQVHVRTAHGDSNMHSNEERWTIPRDQPFQGTLQGAADSMELWGINSAEIIKAMKGEGHAPTDTTALGGKQINYLGFHYVDDGTQITKTDNANIEETDLTFSKGLLKFLGELGEGDYSSAAQTMESLSLSPPKDASQYYERFTKLYEGFESGTSSPTNQMMETVKLCVHSGMEFPQGAFPIIKSLMYLDGMALKCAPEAKLLDDVLAYTVTDRETPS